VTVLHTGDFRFKTSMLEHFLRVPKSSSGDEEQKIEGSSQNKEEAAV
jgi:hypothetical protein